MTLRTALTLLDTALTMPFHTPLRNPLIPFHTPFHQVEMALSALPMVVLTASVAGARKETMAFHVVWKKPLTVFHAPCQSPLMRSRTATIIVRT